MSHQFLSEEEIQAAEQKIQAAHKVVSELCHGERRWTMSVPAEPERDSDLVIDSGLRVSERSLADVRELRRVVRELEKALNASKDALTHDSRDCWATGPLHGDYRDALCPGCSAINTINAALALDQPIAGGK